MRYFLALLALSYAGTAANVWILSGLLPGYLLPDFSFLAIAYAGLFVPGAAGFLAALPAAFFREVTAVGPPWSFFFASLALYFFTREISRRIFLRTEILVLAIVAALLLTESLSVGLLLHLTGAHPFSLLWGAQEAVRIAWTSLLAVPLFTWLASRWQRVKE